VRLTIHVLWSLRMSPAIGALHCIYSRRVQRQIYLYPCEKQSPGTAAARRPTVSFQNAGQVDSIHIAGGLNCLEILPQYSYINNKAHMGYADIKPGIVKCTSQKVSTLLCNLLIFKNRLIQITWIMIPSLLNT
jgi:hypothetical protein